jgi:hypothetical protein
MLLLRLLSTALCAAVAACVFAFAFVYVVPHPQVCPHRAQASQIRVIAGARAARDRGVQVGIVDVAAGVAASEIPALLALRSDEHVAAVNEHVPASDLEAGAWIAARASQHEYLDLTVASPAGERRVLILLH